MPRQAERRNGQRSGTSSLHGAAAPTMLDSCVRLLFVVDFGEIPTHRKVHFALGVVA